MRQEVEKLLSKKTSWNQLDTASVTKISIFNLRQPIDPILGLHKNEERASPNCEVGVEPKVFIMDIQCFVW